MVTDNSGALTQPPPVNGELVEAAMALQRARTAHRLNATLANADLVGEASERLDAALTRAKAQAGDGESAAPLPDELPMETAPRDGTIVWLLVDFSATDEGWCALVDTTRAWTIGFNNLDNTEEDRWQLVGWCWSQDCFIEIERQPLAWRPVGFDLDAALSPAQHSTGEGES